MDSNGRWDIPKKGWTIIVAQSVMILFLAGWMVNEYLNNTYLQQYMSSIAPTVYPILSLVFGATAAMTATTLYIRTRRVARESDKSDMLRPTSTRRAGAAKKRASSSVRLGKVREDNPSVPTPQFIITESKKEEPTPPMAKPESPPIKDDAKPPPVSPPDTSASASAQSEGKP